MIRQNILRILWSGPAAIATSIYIAITLNIIFIPALYVILRKSKINKIKNKYQINSELMSSDDIMISLILVLILIFLIFSFFILFKVRTYNLCIRSNRTDNFIILKIRYVWAFYFKSNLVYLKNQGFNQDELKIHRIWINNKELNKHGFKEGTILKMYVDNNGFPIDYIVEAASD